jgi:hypothetical protein
VAADGARRPALTVPGLFRVIVDEDRLPADRRGRHAADHLNNPGRRGKRHALPRRDELRECWTEPRLRHRLHRPQSTSRTRGRTASRTPTPPPGDSGRAGRGGTVTRRCRAVTATSARAVPRPKIKRSRSSTSSPAA